MEALNNKSSSLEKTILEVKADTELWSYNISQHAVNVFNEYREIEEGCRNKTSDLQTSIEINSFLMGSITDTLKNMTLLQSSVQAQRDDEYKEILSNLRRAQNSTAIAEKELSEELVFLKNEIKSTITDIEISILGQGNRLHNETMNSLTDQLSQQDETLKTNFHETNNHITELMSNSSQKIVNLKTQLELIQGEIVMMKENQQEISLDLSKFESNMTNNLRQTGDNFINANQDLRSDLLRHFSNLTSEGEEKISNHFDVVEEKLNRYMFNTNNSITNLLLHHNTYQNAAFNRHDSILSFLTNISLSATNMTNLQSMMNDEMMTMKSRAEAMMNENAMNFENVRNHYNESISAAQKDVNILREMLQTLQRDNDQQKEYISVLLNEHHDNQTSSLTHLGRVLGTKQDTVRFLLDDILNFHNYSINAIDSKVKNVQTSLHGKILKDEILLNDFSNSILRRVDDLQKNLTVALINMEDGHSLTTNYYQEYVSNQISSVNTTINKQFELTKNSQTEQNENLKQLDEVTSIIKQDLEKHNQRVMNWNITSLLTQLLIKSSHIADLQQMALNKQGLFSDNVTDELDHIFRKLIENEELFILNSVSMNESLAASVNHTRDTLAMDLMKNQQLLLIQVDI